MRALYIETEGALLRLRVTDASGAEENVRSGAD